MNIALKCSSSPKMSQDLTVMPDSSTPTESKSFILDILPDIPISNGVCSLPMQQKIDLILLAIEALELGGSEYMLAMAQELQLEEIIKNRVILWRLRCTNPWRRSYNRNPLTLKQAKALVAIATHMTKRLTVAIRELISVEQQMREKQLPYEQNFHLSWYLERFRAHFRSRMNPRRAKVEFYLSSQTNINQLALSLLAQLLFCTGTTGMQRLWISLFDGEVS